MKHLVLLLVLSLLAYFGWSYAGRRHQQGAIQFMRQHLLRVVLIVSVILAALLAMFYGGAIHLL